jgi:hypothetical protein
MLPDDGLRDVRHMAQALRQMPVQKLPSEEVIPGLLDGLDNVHRLTRRWLAPRADARPRLAVSNRE